MHSCNRLIIITRLSGVITEADSREVSAEIQALYVVKPHHTMVWKHGTFNMLPLSLCSIVEMQGNRFLIYQLGNFMKLLCVHYKVWDEAGVEYYKANQAGNITNRSWWWPSPQVLMLGHGRMITILADINAYKLYSGWEIWVFFRLKDRFWDNKHAIDSAYTTMQWKERLPNSECCWYLFLYWYRCQWSSPWTWLKLSKCNPCCG